MSEYVYGTDEQGGHWLTGEEIVRCRDCKRFSLDNSDHDYRSGWWCHRWNTDMVKPDGFCAWGEKEEVMSITDELRNWMENAFTYKTVDGDMFHKVNTPWFGWKRDIEEMLDRIDAEHESKVSYWQDASYKDGYDEGFASADDYFTDKRETLKEHGWIRLPLDSDGVPIRVGDVMCNTHKDGFMAKRVTGLCAHSSGRWTVEVDEARLRWHDADKLCHYHEPTVEDVLREFAEKVIDSQIPDVHPTYEEAIAEYAAKLRLAGEGE